MKIFFIVITCLLGLDTVAQTQNNVFHIVDAETKKSIPYVSVTIVKSNAAINTESDGVLSIPGDISKKTDTAIFSAQNYVTVKTPLYKIAGRDTLPLRPAKFRQIDNAVPSNTGKDSVINGFKWQDVGYFAGLHTTTSRFNYLQLAQFIEAPVIGSGLKKITICRLGHVITGGTGLLFTRFRVRVYEVNKMTGNPGRDLCSQIIEVKNTDDLDLQLDLSQYKIIIPGKNFFVAIEWLRTYENAAYSISRDEKNLAYKPTIGISPKTGAKLNIWGLTYAHKWEPFTYFSPFGTDLAISATLSY